MSTITETIASKLNLISKKTDEEAPSTASSLPIPSGDTKATLSYFVNPADGSKPFQYVEHPPAGEPRQNFKIEDHTVTIRDIRGKESDYNLDTHAFQALTVPASSPQINWTDDASIKQHYYPEVESLLLSTISGSPHKVIIFDHTIRKAKTGREPVTRVHIDQTLAATAERVRLHADPAEYPALSQGRYRIINVWRPLNGPVHKHPLAVAASATVNDADVLGVEHRYPNRTGETAGVRYNPAQEWFYLSGMRNEERLLLKCADTDQALEGRRVPHTAFVHPDEKQGAPGRESIEVRALVFG